MSDELSVASLRTSLEELVDWESVALYLPGMTKYMVDIIQRDNPCNTQKQKLALYCRWLDVCPSPTWNHVHFALEKAGKTTLAKKIKHKSDGERATEKHLEVIDENVVVELQQLSQTFEKLMSLAEQKCSELVSNSVVHLNDLVKTCLSHEIYRTSGTLQNAASVDELFKSLNYCLCTFLDFDALEKVINKLPQLSAPELKSKFLAYKSSVHEFKKKTEIRNLKNKIKPLIRRARMEEIRLKVIFELEEATGKLSLSLFETLLETLFSGLHNKLTWYEVVPGSTLVTFISYHKFSQLQLEFLSKELEKRHSFLRLLGVINLSIYGLNEKISFSSKCEDKSMMVFHSFESSLLQAASSTSNVEALLFLLNEIKVDVDYQNPLTHETALSIAVENNHTEIAQIILNAKANPNHQIRDDGNTPLHIACYKGYTQLAIMLIEYGANPLITNTKGDTPFLSSIRGNMIEVVKMFTPKLPESEIPPSLLLACRLGYSDIISYLLQHVDPSNHSAIHQYCANGELALAAEHIVQFNEDINCIVALGITPLMIAASCGHVEVVECLIQANSDVNSIDNDGYSPLAYAITGSRSVPVIECLLQAGANPSITVGGVSLIQMAKQQDIAGLLLRYMAVRLHDMFSSLVNKIHEDMTCEIKEHKTTLQKIKEKIKAEFIDIEGLAEVNTLSELFVVLQPFYDFLSWKAISLLSGHLKQEGYFQAVKELEGKVEIELFSQLQATISLNVASTNLPSSSCCSVSLNKQWSDKTLFNLRGLCSLLFESLAHFISHLTITCTQHEKIILNYNMPKSIQVTERLQAILLQKHEVFTLLGVNHIHLDNNVLLMAKIDPSFKLEMALINVLSSTSLSSSNKLEIVKRLITFKGIDVNNIRKEKGLTALHMACNDPNNSVKVVDTLLSHGADPNVKNEHGQTPLMTAAYVGHYAIVERLVTKCLDSVSTPDFENRTPLMYACFYGHFNIVEFLLMKGIADPNSLSKSGETALIVASASFRELLDVMKLLLEAGADPNLGNLKHKSSCLMIASALGKVKTVKLLLHHNADYKYTVQHRGVPMDSFAFACAAGYKELVDVFLSSTASALSDTSLSIGWYMACLYNHPHLIMYLVYSLPQLSNSKRELVLAYVNSGLISRLLRHNPDDEFLHGVTPLMIACSCDNAGLVKTLLNAGASSTTDEFGYQPIAYCKQSSPIPDMLRDRFGSNMEQQTFDKTVLLRNIENIFPVSKDVPSFETDNEYLPPSISVAT